MEFNFNCEDVLRVDQDGFTMIDGAYPERYKRRTGAQPGINAHRSSSFSNQGANDKNLTSDEMLDQIINRMGEASAKA